MKQLRWRPIKIGVIAKGGKRRDGEFKRAGGGVRPR